MSLGQPGPPILRDPHNHQIILAVKYPATQNPKILNPQEMNPNPNMLSRNAKPLLPEHPAVLATCVGEETCELDFVSILQVILVVILIVLLVVR